MTLLMVVGGEMGKRVEAAREFDYTAGTEKATKLTKKRGWTVVSMKQEWKQIFSFQGRR